MKNFWKDERLLWGVYALVAIIVSVQKLTQGPNDAGYTSYENYVIFRNSFAHLLAGQNPYAAFPAEQWDLFKYSPSFALFMAPFSVLPDWLGLPLWNLLNALSLLAAILALPVLDARKRRFMAWFVLLELITSLQNSQSNGLTAALLLGAFVAFERGRPGHAALWTVAGAFLKIFGIFAAVWAPMYHGKGRFVLVGLAWGLGFLLLPLLVLSPAQTVQVYKWWGELLQQDHAASLGLSVSGWLHSWFGWLPDKNAVTGGGLLLLGASAVAVFRAPDLVRRSLLAASVLIWVVIFNHKAESPTFVIALSGVALWYLAQERPARWQTAALWITFALVSLTPTDLCPKSVREQWVQPYVLKAVPCIMLWIALTAGLIRTLFTNRPPADVSAVSHE